MELDIIDCLVLFDAMPSDLKDTLLGIHVPYTKRPVVTCSNDRRDTMLGMRVIFRRERIQRDRDIETYRPPEARCRPEASKLSDVTASWWAIIECVHLPKKQKKNSARVIQQPRTEEDR